MENMIDSKDFRIINYLTVKGMDSVTEDLIIEKHKFLRGKKVDLYGIIVNADDQFIKNTLDRTLLYPYYTKAVEDFIKSDYLSDIFLENIVYILNKIPNCERMIEDLKGKRINDLGFLQLSVIYQELINYYREDTEHTETNNLAINCFVKYLSCLDGKGPTELVSTIFDNKKLGSFILTNSGLSNIALSSNATNVNKKNLDENNLYSMYKKIAKFRPDAAEEFVKLVNNTKSINPKAFLNNYNQFVERNFSCDGLKYFDGEITFDFINKITLFSLLKSNRSKVNRKPKMDRLLQSRASDDIKYQFYKLTCEVKEEEKKLTK